MTLKAAVVGCGMLANSTHLPHIQQSKTLELAVACDVDARAAEAAARQWGAKRVSTDWHEVVRAKDVDLIVLCTHTNLRADLICEAVANKKPVYTEKPLANSTREMVRIHRAVAETGVPVCVGHNRRSSPAVLEFRRLLGLARTEGSSRPAIVDRNTGKRELLPEERQTQLLIRVNDDSRSWKLWVFEDEEGIILAEMVHFIDLALWLMPSPPVEVYACGSARGNFTEILRFADGSIATLQHSMVGNFDFPKELIEATVNHVTIALDHHVEVRQRGLEREPFRTTYPVKASTGEEKQGIDAFHEGVEALQALRRQGRPLPVAMVGVEKGHRHHLERFGLHIQGKGENPCPVESAIVVTRVALKLLESVRLGLPVKVGPEDWHLVRGRE